MVPTAAGLADEEVVERVRAGQTSLYEILMRRHNQRLYRVARSILRDPVEAEDVMQEAYVRAYEHLDQFAGEARFSTWLTKIAVYEALRRLRRRARAEGLEAVPEAKLMAEANSFTDPESRAYGRELAGVLERAIDGLPDPYRVVFVLRAVENLSVAETAACLEIGTEAVKSRFHRARAMLRKDLEREAGIAAPQVYTFHLSRCGRVVEAVFRRITPDQRAV